MLLEINFPRPEDASFDACADILYKTCKCKPLKKKRYLTLDHLMSMLPMQPRSIVNFIITSDKIHGFIYEGGLYVHPTKFASRYLRIIMRGVDKGVREVKEVVH